MESNKICKPKAVNETLPKSFKSESLDQIYSNMHLVPIWKKTNLTITEAIEYSGIGRDKLLDITNTQNCDFVLFVGKKRLIKRRKFEKFLDSTYSL